MDNIPLIPLHRLVSTTDFYTIPNARSIVKLYSRIPYEIITRLPWCFYLFYLYAVLVPSFLSKCRGSREKNSSVDLMWLIFIAFPTAFLITQPLIWLKNNFWKESSQRHQALRKLSLIPLISLPHLEVRLFNSDFWTSSLLAFVLLLSAKL